MLDDIQIPFSSTSTSRSATASSTRTTVPGRSCKELRTILGEEREYLTIKILHNDMTVMVPVEKAAEVGLRRVIDEETVLKVLAVLEAEMSEMPKNWNRRFKHNRDKMKTGDIYELSEVVRNLAFREHDKGLSTGEKQMYTRAKKILASELMYALDKNEEEAEAHLDDSPAHARRPPTRSGAPLLRVALCSSPPGRASGWDAESPRRSPRSPVGRCSSGRSRRCRAAPSIDRIVVPPCPPGVAAPRGHDRRRRRRSSARSRSATRCAAAARRPRARPRRRAPAADRRARRGASSPRSSTTADAAIAAAPVTDTIKQARDGDRAPGPSTAPGCGRSRRRRCSAATVLERALAQADEVLAAATDDASLVEALGGTRRIVAAPPENFKVTTPHDLRVAELLLGERARGA